MGDQGDGWRGRFGGGFRLTPHVAAPGFDTLCEACWDMGVLSLERRLTLRRNNNSMNRASKVGQHTQGLE